MPCSSDGYPDPNVERAAREVVRRQRAEQAACELAKILKRENGGDWKRKKNGISISETTMKWILEHEKEDVLRLAREAEIEKRRIKEHKLELKKKKVLKKLSKEERELLGV